MAADGKSLVITGLSKTFPGQRALEAVSLELQAGEVHCLLGQNGSGKSTLIKVLAGYHAPDEGAAATFDGSPIELRQADADWRGRVRFIHQDLGLVGSLSVMDNLALGRGFHRNRIGLIQWRSERRRAARLLREFGLDLDASRPASALSPAERTMVAIARALQDWDEDDFGVLVLDEPTASLAVSEVARLFRTIQTVAASGKAVLFVSHRLEEVLEIGDRVTILRDGRLVASQPVAGLDHDQLAALIVGRPLDSLYTTPPPPSPDCILAVTGLRGGRVLDVSLQVRRAEILGVAGLVGSGREELANLIFGASRRAGGDVEVDGARLPPGEPRRAVSAGVALVPADRAEAGIIGTFPVRQNLTLPALGTLCAGWWLRERAERRECAEWISLLDVRPPLVDRRADTLSGGNQQKVVLAKWLRTRPRVLLLDEPTQGVDVGAKSEIYRIVAAAAAEGVGVLVASSDAGELAHMCDRVVVMRGGIVSVELSGAALTEDRVALETLRSDPSAGGSDVALQSQSASCGGATA